MRLKE